MNVSRIYRLLRLVTLLQSGRNYTAHELAEELQVSRRTVFRDLNALEMAHIPYYYDAATHGYRISPHFFLQPVNLTLGESLAILALTGRLQSESSVPLLSEGARAAAKLESILPPSIREHVGSIIDQLSVRLGPMAKHDGANKYFDQLAGAIIRKNVCKMQYDSFYEGKSINVTIHPRRLVFMQRAWYVLAWSLMHKEIRTFKLVRIEQLEVTKREFTPRGDVTPELHFGNAWAMIPEGKMYKVHLHFTPKVAGNAAEVQWHSSQRVEWNEDGSLEFFADVDGIGEISWWVLGYGDQVKVISPKPLANRVAKMADNIRKQYCDGAGR